MRALPLNCQRRRVGAVLMAVIAVGALIRLRSTCEAYGVLALDVALNAVLVLATVWLVAKAGFFRKCPTKTVFSQRPAMLARCTSNAIRSR